MGRARPRGRDRPRRRRPDPRGPSAAARRGRAVPRRGRARVPPERLTAMDQRLSFVTLGSRDREASRRFYRDGLGWAPIMDIDEITFFQMAPGVVLGIWSSDELATDGATPWPDGAGAPAGF